MTSPKSVDWFGATLGKQTQPYAYRRGLQSSARNHEAAGGICDPAKTTLDHPAFEKDDETVLIRVAFDDN